MEEQGNIALSGDNTHYNINRTPSRNFRDDLSTFTRSVSAKPYNGGKFIVKDLSEDLKDVNKRVDTRVYSLST